MACRTGEACGLTETRSGARRCANHSDVMIDTIEALEAWWPPTFTPEGFGRTLFAWWTMAVASHRTRRSLARSCSTVGVTGAASAAVVPGASGGDGIGGLRVRRLVDDIVGDLTYS